MPPRALHRLSIRLARRWLLTLIVSELAVFAASYFYFTTMHALESFDTASCIPLTAGKCVSSLQVLLNDDQKYLVVSVDGYFGRQTKQAVIEFQSAHHLAPDGIVGSQTASVINKLSPRPNISSYTAGFANSTLALSAKLCVAALMVTVVIICLLLRATRAGSSRLLGIRCFLAGLIAAIVAANSIAMKNLMAEAHGWVAKLLWIILVGLTAALIFLLREIFSRHDPPPGFR